MKARQKMYLVWIITLVFSAVNPAWADPSINELKTVRAEYVHKKTGAVYTGKEKISKLKLKLDYDFVPAHYIDPITKEPANGSFEKLARGRKMLVTLKNGRENGPTKVFYRNSDKIEKIQYYENGQFTGAEEGYRKDGTLWYKKWKEQKYSRIEDFWPDGTLMAKVQWNHNSLQQDNYAYYPDGKVKIKILVSEEGSDAPYVTAAFYDVQGKEHQITAEMVDAFFKHSTDKINDGWLEKRSVEDYLRRATSYYNNDRSLRAILIYNAVLEQEPDNLQALFLRARSFGVMGRNKTAISDYTTLIKLAPNLPYPYQWRAWMYNRLRDYQKAYTDFAKADPLDSQAAPEWMKGWEDTLQDEFAKSCQRTGHYDKAIEIYKAKLDKKPDTAWVHRELAAVYTAKKEYATALTYYQKYLSLDPKSPSPYNSLAWFYATVPDAEYRNGPQAVAMALKAIGLNEKGMYLDTLAAAYTQNKAPDKAVDTYDKAMRLDGKKRIKRYQAGLQKNGYYTGAVDGNLSDALMQAITACVKDGHYPTQKLAQAKPEGGIKLLD